MLIGPDRKLFRSIQFQNFMAAKLIESQFLRFVSGRLNSITGHIGVKRSVNFALCFRSGAESFGFKKLVELVWTFLYVFHRSMK